MKQLRPGLWAMESCPVHVYLLKLADRVFLVDPGMGFQLNLLGRELTSAGRSPYDVTDILLTHYDNDHADTAAEWRRRTGASVWLGAADAEILRTGRPPATPLRRLSGRRMPELPEGVRELEGEVEIVPGLRAIPTPGHTPGSYTFLWSDVALIGDAARTGRDGRLRAMPGFLMTDVAQAEASRAMLAALPVGLFCCGHSAPRPIR